MKEFLTAARDAEARDEQDDFGFDVEFAVVDDRKEKDDPQRRRVMTAYKPSRGQVLALQALAGDDLRANTEVISFGIRFLNSLLESEDRRYISRRLMDMKDPFGEEEIAEILEYIIGEWTGKAGGSQPASRASRRTSGRSSTASRSRTA
jgi:hypothetical protein